MKKKLPLAIIPLVIVAIVIAVSCNRNKTVRPERKSITEAVYASGYIVPRNEYKVYALSDGYITARFKNAGDDIKKGEVLYQVQNEASSTKYGATMTAYDIAKSNADENSAILSDLRNKINSAKAKFSNDSLNYVRYKNMFNAGAATKSQLDQASLAYEVSGNDLRSAQQGYQKTRDQLQVELKNAQSVLSASGLDLSNFQVKSMMDGMVYDMTKELGEAVRRNDLVATIGEKEHKYLKLSVDQQDITKVKLGLEIVVKMDVTGGKIYKAKVSKIYPDMNQNDQSFKVEAEFDSSYNFSFVHASVEANIIVDHKDSAWLIPRSVLIGDDMVELKGLGMNKPVKIKKGLETLEYVEVVDGLKETDEIVVPKAK